MRNKLVLVGMLSQYRAYLNVPKEEALARYLKDEGRASLDDDYIEEVREFEFDDEFETYLAGPKQELHVLMSGKPTRLSSL